MVLAWQPGIVIIERIQTMRQASLGNGHPRRRQVLLRARGARAGLLLKVIVSACIATMRGVLLRLLAERP